MSDRKMTPAVFKHFCGLIKQGFTVSECCWQTDISRVAFYKFANTSKRWKEMLVRAQKWKRMSAEEKILEIRAIARSKLGDAAAGFDPEQIDLSKASDWLRMAGLFQEPSALIQNNTQHNTQINNITRIEYVGADEEDALETVEDMAVELKRNAKDANSERLKLNKPE